MKYAAVVHHEAGVNPTPHLSQDVSHVRRHEQLADLVLDRGNRFVQKLFVVVFKFIHPKRPHHRIFDLPHHPRPIPAIGKHPLDAEQAHIVAV